MPLYAQSQYMHGKQTGIFAVRNAPYPKKNVLPNYMTSYYIVSIEKCTVSLEQLTQSLSFLVAGTPIS